jgi:membrane protein YqaA with SNARE-associated domain
LKIFTPIYDAVLAWAGRPHAQRYLWALSFAESSFFPVPPDVLLAPLVLARPHRAWFLAAGTTLSSVVGGLAGYAIGWLAIDAVRPLLESAGYLQGYEQAMAWFGRWGFLAGLAAGVSPIPDTLFTIAAGALHMLLPPFVLASLIGRGGRFFLVAALIRWGGQPMQLRLRQHIDVLGWLSIAALVLLYFWLRE